MVRKISIAVKSLFFPLKKAIAHPPCRAIHTFPPQWCTPNNFSLPCRQQLLMCLYFYPDSHLLSSATTSHVYQSVHLPGGYTHLLSLSQSSSPLRFSTHFLKGQVPTGPLGWRDVEKWEELGYLQFANGHSTTWRTKDTTVKSIGQLVSAVAIISLK